MKKTVILIGILIWLGLAAVFTVFLVSGLSGSPAPGFLGHFTDGGWRNIQFGGTGEVLVRTETFDSGGLEKLQLESRSQAVIVSFTDGDLITVTQYGHEGAPAFTDTRSDRSLHISTPPVYSVGFFTMSFNPRLEVSLPRQYKEAVEISANSGTIRVNGDAEWGDVSLRATSGSIRAEDSLRCAGLSVKTNSGSQHFGSVTAAAAEFSAISGTIRLGDVMAEGMVSIEANSGAVHAGRLAASDFAVKTSSGSIRLGELDGRGILRSTSGSIHAEAMTLRGDVTSESSSGSQRLGLAKNASCRLELGVGSGSIHADGCRLSFDSRGKNATGTVGAGEDGTLKVVAASGSIRIN